MIEILRAIGAVVMSKLRTLGAMIIQAWPRSRGANVKLGGLIVALIIWWRLSKLGISVIGGVGILTAIAIVILLLRSGLPRFWQWLRRKKDPRPSRNLGWLWKMDSVFLVIFGFDLMVKPTAWSSILVLVGAFAVFNFLIIDWRLGLLVGAIAWGVVFYVRTYDVEPLIHRDIAYAQAHSSYGNENCRDNPATEDVSALPGQPVIITLGQGCFTGSFNFPQPLSQYTMIRSREVGDSFAWRCAGDKAMTSKIYLWDEALNIQPGCRSLFVQGKGSVTFVPLSKKRKK